MNSLSPDLAPFWHLVPKDKRANLAWRHRVLRMAKSDPRAAALIREMCRRDPLFFVSGFLLIYEPRTEPPEVRPFITYPFQDQSVLTLLESFGRRDHAVEKSRDQGASWLWLAFIVWRWCFYPMGDYMLVSRTEALVDAADDRDALMVKVEFMVSRLPGFLRPNYTRRFKVMVNNDKGGVITGTATTADIGVGGRKTAILMDEFARFKLADGYEVLGCTQHTTNCRMFISTPHGDSGAYFDVMNRSDPMLVKHRFHWSNHPVQRRGMYRMVEGTPHFFCTACYQQEAEPDTSLCLECARAGLKADPYLFPTGYQFGTTFPEFKLRSPWFDQHAAKAPSKSYIAREIEIDYGGSVSRLFDSLAIEHLIEVTAREPDETVSLREFLEHRKFKVSDKPDVIQAFWERAYDAEIGLWSVRDPNTWTLPMDRPYTLGADISAGTGASNSAISVFDVKEKRKVLEFIHNRIGPTDLGDIAVEIARWLGNAFMMWEHQGQGSNFGQRVIDRGYQNVYNRRNEESWSRKETDTPGWTPTETNKIKVLETYKDAIESQEAVNPSRAALLECNQFIYDDQGRIIHKKSVQGDDPSGRNKFHGDIVIADALAWYPIAKRMVKHERAQAEKTIPTGSRAWRDREWRKRQDSQAPRYRQMRVRAC
jgi:hypothetical protein